MTVEFPPEVYKEHDHAAHEAERWARVLARRARERIERPFQDRWQVGEEWIRVIPSFVAEESHEVWVGTYWGRDGIPDPEAELFADGNEARRWVREPAAGAVLLEFHETAWSAAARFRVRGGEEEAEAHRVKIVTFLRASGASWPRGSDHLWAPSDRGRYPQGPDLYALEAARDRALRQVIEDELSQGDWKDFVSATAEGNYVETELSSDWRERWDQLHALDWLVGFDFISDGGDVETRSFESTIHH
ncbi:MAG: hypothetical protein L0206_15735 [Actinobacteria bacterium]|nr:hypothetical protein [Actinomycetota bacterium]